MIIVSGPSTVGKNPFIYKACELYKLKYLIPYTTRIKRSDEEYDKDYFFLSKKDFQQKIKERKINEWDYCLDNYYGYSYDFSEQCCQITHGLSRMALRIKNKNPNNITTIFLMPSNKDKIFSNLKHIYSGKMLAQREALVEEELCHSVLFDKVFICNDSVFDLLHDQEMIQLIQCEITSSYI